MLNIEARTNNAKVASQLSKAGRKQIPFASAVALTKTAQHAQSVIRKGLDKHFTIRSQYVPKGIRIKPAEKRDWPNQSAEVGTTDSFMAIHAFGGERQPRSASNLAIPGRSANVRTRTGRTKKSMTPRALLSKPKYFIFEGDKGDPFIAKRMGEDVQIMWLLRPDVSIEKRWPFQRTAEAAVQSAYGKEFGAALAKALRTAR